MPQPASRHLFGREHELAVLGRALSDALRGNGRVVWISGEPGIGTAPDEVNAAATLWTAGVREEASSPR